MKIHTNILRAIAQAEQHRWAYGSDLADALRHHGVDAYVDERTDAGGGMRYAVAIKRDDDAVVEKGKAIVRAHRDLFPGVAARFPGANVDSIVSALADSDAHLLRWWADSHFAVVAENRDAGQP